MNLSDSNIPLEDSHKLTLFDKFEIIHDYIPTPEGVIQRDILNLIDSINQKINSIQEPEIQPFHSHTYGKIRKEAYNRFLEIIDIYSGSKRKQYIRLFYKDIDIKFEQLFSQKCPAKEKYRKEVIRNEPKTFSQETLEADESEFLHKEINELILDWYLLVDQIVDALTRCQVYHVKDEISFKQLYSNLNSNWNKKKTGIKEQWFSNGFKSSIHRLKEVFSYSSPEQKSVKEVELKDLQLLVFKMTCEHVISGFLNATQSHNNKKILIRIKGYLTLLTQNMDSIVKSFHALIDEYLSGDSISEEKDPLEEFDNLIDQLIDLESHMTLFDKGFLQEYFKDGSRETSTHESSQSDY